MVAATTVKLDSNPIKSFPGGFICARERPLSAKDNFIRSPVTLMSRCPHDSVVAATIIYLERKTKALFNRNQVRRKVRHLGINRRGEISSFRKTSSSNRRNRLIRRSRVGNGTSFWHILFVRTGTVLRGRTIAISCVFLRVIPLSIWKERHH